MLNQICPSVAGQIVSVLRERNISVQNEEIFQEVQHLCRQSQVCLLQEK